MTSFNTLFNRMFQEKSKSVYLIYLIQVFASLCFTIMSSFGMGGSPKIVYGDVHESTNVVVAYIFVFAVMMFITSFFANFVYWIISSVKNERINRSQTWCLIPISDTKFLLSNFGTAFFSYIWLGILELLTIIVASLPLIISSNELHKLMRAASFDFNASDWEQLLGSLILIVLLGYAWYAIVSLLNLSSRSIIDFLPSSSSKFLMFVVRVVIIIAIIWLLSYASGALFSVLGKYLPFAASGNNNFEIGTTLLGFFAFDVIITTIDILLLNKFVEAKQN